MKQILDEALRTLKRAGVYLRVSTTRQAEGDVSIPAQREYVEKFCAANGYSIVDLFIEPGASASHGVRPVFDQMLERAYDEDHPYDVIIVYSFLASIATALKWRWR